MVKHLKDIETSILEQNQFSSEDIILTKLEECFTNKDIQQSVQYTSKYYSIIVLTEGRYNHKVDFKSYELEKGNLLVISPDKLQEISQIEGIQGYLLNFTEDFVMDYVLSNSNFICSEFILKFHEYGKINLDDNSFFQVKLLMTLLENETRQMNSVNHRLILQNILSTVLIYMDNPNNVLDDELHKDLYISLVLRFKLLLSKGVKHSYDVTHYAEKLSVSVRTLQLATKKVLNQSPKDLITHHLIMQIKRKLLNMDLQIKEVAYSLDFVDSTVFAKYFKKHTSMTPNEFRKIMVNKPIS